MEVELRFKVERIKLDLPVLPRQGEWVRLAEFDRDLRVDRVVWAREGVFLELEDPTGGHVWEGGPEGWGCKRCGWMVMSSVAPGHPNFPGSEQQRATWLGDCDEEIAKSVHAV